LSVVRCPGSEWVRGLRVEGLSFSEEDSLLLPAGRWLLTAARWLLPAGCCPLGSGVPGFRGRVGKR
jgi:hypothetical protein